MIFDLTTTIFTVVNILIAIALVSVLVIIVRPLRKK
jgi:competence protein ComGC